MEEQSHQTADNYEQIVPVHRKKTISFFVFKLCVMAHL
jgi:hypothetical protein